jgi:hypothetical protein
MLCGTVCTRDSSGQEHGLIFEHLYVSLSSEPSAACANALGFRDL